MSPDDFQLSKSKYIQYTIILKHEKQQIPTNLWSNNQRMCDK